ncbi:MAG: cobalamin-independent methionine synthase II family protein [Xanthobacteraceae bacterium]
MKHSTDRILTTHVGSLPRPPELIAMVRATLRGEAVDPQAHAKVLKDSVAGIVRKQAELGVDVIDDGEFGKPSFVSYGNERLAGFSPRRDGGGVSPWAASREALAFPEFYQTQMGSVSSQHARLVCTGPVTYTGQAALKTDLDNLKAALNGVSPAEVFVPSISPASFEDWNKNEYYNSDEDYVAALGEAMRTEYQAVIDAGFLLQIDDPRLVTYYILYPDKSIADCRRWAELRVEALNHALRGIPTEKIRYHTCYGINMGPRVHDMELKDIVDIILRIRAGAYSFEASNPRHEHEWTVWRDAKRPDGTILIPGVISHSTVLVEHPELIAQRLTRYANIVGRENVIAGTDCGFATFAGADEIHPSIVWAKFEALVQGARIASRELWG